MASRFTTSALRSFGQTSGLLRTPSGFLSRSFSATSYNALRHTFIETDNAPLNEILKEIQEQYIFPALLPFGKRRMVFDANKRRALEKSPIIIEVDGIEHRFTTMDLMKRPESKEILNKALEAMSTKDDWENLQTLLVGYRKAAIKIQPRQLRKMTRLAVESGNVYEIIECAKQADHTGFKLNDEEIIARILAGINEKVTDSSWGLTQTKKAQSWTNIILDLLHTTEHKSNTFSIRKSRIAHGLALFTQASAVRVKKQAGESVEKDLALLQDQADIMATLWKRVIKGETEGLAESESEQAWFDNRHASGKSTGRTVLSGFHNTQVLSQTIKGIMMAKEFLGETAERLTPVEKYLDDIVQRILQSEAAPQKGWQRAYDEAVTEVAPEPVEEEDSFSTSAPAA